MFLARASPCSLHPKSARGGGHTGALQPDVCRGQPWPLASPKLLKCTRPQLRNPPRALSNILYDGVAASPPLSCTGPGWWEPGAMRTQDPGLFCLGLVCCVLVPLHLPVPSSHPVDWSTRQRTDIRLDYIQMPICGTFALHKEPFYLVQPHSNCPPSVEP